MDVRGRKSKQDFPKKHCLFRGGSGNEDESPAWFSLIKGRPVSLLPFVPVDTQPLCQRPPQIPPLLWTLSSSLPEIASSSEILYFLSVLSLGIEYTSL